MDTAEDVAPRQKNGKNITNKSDTKPAAGSSNKGKAVERDPKRSGSSSKDLSGTKRGTFKVDHSVQRDDGSDVDEGDHGSEGDAEGGASDDRRRRELKPRRQDQRDKEVLRDDAEGETDAEGEDDMGEEDEEEYLDDADEDEERTEHEDDSQDEQQLRGKQSHTQTNTQLKRRANDSVTPTHPTTAKKPSTNASTTVGKQQPEGGKGKGKGKEKETEKVSQKEKGKGKGKGDTSYVVAHSSTHSPLITPTLARLLDVRTKEDLAKPPAKKAASSSKDSSTRRYVSQPSAKSTNTTEVPERRCFSQADVSLSSLSPQWLRDATRHFRSLDFSDSRWLGIVNCLLRLEFAMSFPDSQVRYLYMFDVARLHVFLVALQPPNDKQPTTRNWAMDPGWTTLRQRGQAVHAPTGESIRGAA